MDVQAVGRFLWKLLVVVVLTLGAMAAIGLVVRLLFGVEVEEIAAAWGRLS